MKKKNLRKAHSVHIHIIQNLYKKKNSLILIWIYDGLYTIYVIYSISHNIYKQIRTIIHHSFKIILHVFLKSHFDWYRERKEEKKYSIRIIYLKMGDLYFIYSSIYVHISIMYTIHFWAKEEEKKKSTERKELLSNLFWQSIFMYIIYIMFRTQKKILYSHTHFIYFSKENASWKYFPATNMHANDCMYTFIEIMYWVVFFLFERDLDFKCMKRKKKLKRKYYDDDDELEIKYLNSKPQIEVRYYSEFWQIRFCRGIIKVNRNKIYCSFQQLLGRFFFFIFFIGQQQ